MHTNSNARASPRRKQLVPNSHHVHFNRAFDNCVVLLCVYITRSLRAYIRPPKECPSEDLLYFSSERIRCFEEAINAFSAFSRFRVSKMGGAVSTGDNNDDLIDNLLEADYIRTAMVEHVFRAVDRGHYFLPEARGDAYKDVAWKSNHLHMSAPCIYTEVMEGLCLQEGLSFLNLGSGTGYLSTLVGLILGSRGINHGIEYHEDVVQYAYRRLEEFKKQSGAIDEFDFSEPKFVVGNCLCLSTNLRYDRIYCGAGCPSAYEGYIKSLLKVGGILVMPLNDQLIQVKRLSETAYELNGLLPVSFATLITPDKKDDVVELLSVEPLSLQHLCRSKVRNILRKNIERENPEAIKRPRHSKKHSRKDRVLRRLNVPWFDDLDSSDEEQITFGRNEATGRAIIMVHTQSSDEQSEPDERPEIPDLASSDTDESRDQLPYMLRDFRTLMEMYPMPAAENGRRESTRENNSENEIVPVPIESNQSTESRNNEAPNAENSTQENERMDTDAGVPFNVEEIQAAVNLYADEDIEMSGSASNTEPDHTTTNGNNSNATGENGSAEAPSTSKGGRRRIKFDSGYGDEIDEKESAVGTKRAKVPSEFHNDPKWRRINYSDQSSGSDSENMVEEEGEVNIEQQIMVPSPYTPLMKNKIEELPLPHVLKKYLNYYREF